MHFSDKDLFGLIVGTSFAAGLNVYATLATLGLLSRAHIVEIPASLSLVESWWVIGISGVLFVIEFFADKIPVFDLIWNALHTFVRIPVAALLAYHASAQLPPHVQMIAAVAGGAIAFAAHGGKTAARAAVTPSPEPLSNSALSIGEDVAAIGLTWFATQHPYVAAATVAVLLVFVFLFVRFVVRALKRLFRGAEKSWEKVRAA
ncbi:MAG TPA: DUF4126 domain-containing protein [Terriglobales bacterium]|nr:DUF4126 domain-containing protein [Terriglobales bacterium]